MQLCPVMQQHGGIYDLRHVCTVLHCTQLSVCAESKQQLDMLGSLTPNL